MNQQMIAEQIDAALLHLVIAQTELSKGTSLQSGFWQDRLETIIDTLEVLEEEIGP